jgi:hypothetical protein
VSPPATTDLTLLRDEVRAADLAVRHWEQELATAEADVLALDGFVTTLLSRLTGSRERMIETAVTRVRDVTIALTEAQRRRDEAHAAYAWAESQSRREEEALAEAREEIERHAMLVRSSDHPLAAPLAAIEVELEAARRRVDVASAGFEACLGAIGALGEVIRASGKAEQTALGALAWVENPLEGVQQLARTYDTHSAIVRWRDAAARLQEVVRATGVDFSTGARDESAPWAWLAAGDNALLELGHLHAVSQQTDRFENVRDEVRMLSQGFAMERRRASEDVAAIEQRRATLLGQSRSGS